MSALNFLAASFVLLLIPLVGFLFVRELAGYLRQGQEQVAVAAAKLVSASLSDRPELLHRDATEVDLSRDSERERILALFAASDPATISQLGNRYQQSVQVERILNQSGFKDVDGRIWVVDANGQVRGLVGSLAGASEKPASPASTTTAREKFSAITAPILRHLMPIVMPPSGIVNKSDSNTNAVLRQAERAAIGEPNVEWRRLPENIHVLSVAQPIWQGENVIAAVVIEETDVQYRRLAKSAAESVLLITLIVFFVTFGVLVALAFRIAARLARLQREANQAIDAQGRVRGAISATSAEDEIGALSATLQAMVSRQASYNNYLEQLAARLSHELRTPVAVVRSSLDNLRVSPLNAEDKIFLSRADEGVARLSQIIARMSEATQLERILEGAQHERVNLVALISGCVAGYVQTFTHQQFSFTADVDELQIDVVPDAINQMLDKLVQNAIDFAAETKDVPIKIALIASAKYVLIQVENKGPLLPPSDKEIAALFDSMVSKRNGESTDAHLGLGLYIARLIAEFHRAQSPPQI
ncbi:MAG: hypothetical protein HC782_00450 [Gammaproteobacteria bacterium]|nr:hypothetical protein [Gammaproteobacteria bacterium]